MVQWLLEYGGAQIIDTDEEGGSVWTDNRQHTYYGLPAKPVGAYIGYYDGEYAPYGDIVELTAMLCVLVLHGGPPESLAQDMAPPLQQIVEDGARLRARLPAYLAQRRALLDAHCPPGCRRSGTWCTATRSPPPPTSSGPQGSGHSCNVLNARGLREASPLSAALRACVRSASDAHSIISHAAMVLQY
jgi:hypothetical protein